MRSSLIAILAETEWLNDTEVQQIQQHFSDNGRIASALLTLSQPQIQAITQYIGERFSLPVVDLHQLEYTSICQALALRELICRYQALPIFYDESTLTLAVVDPSIQEVSREFSFTTGLTVNYCIVPADQLVSAIHQLYGRNADHIRSLDQDVSYNELSTLEDSQVTESGETDLLSEDDSPVSRFIQQVLLDAIRRQASDVHFEPYEQQYRIRLRCDGVLVNSPHSANHLSRRLTARLKILARLDIAERRLPQDGRLKLRINEKHAIDMRVSTLPTLWGEKVVLRLLDNHTTSLDIHTLGFNPTQQKLYLAALNKPQGMILFTGPTGSGKTVSLYAGLNHLNTQNVNISTIEDPVEINLSGINQVHVAPEIGLTFATALRAFLRQDPDIIMVGEIRDTETAQIAITAAQTGHLVLSTLHTNSAIDSLTRLLNMGIASYHLAASLTLIVSQRLLRKLCSACKQPYDLPNDWQQRLSITSTATLYQANKHGCPHCTHGYSGRLGIYEMMPLTPELLNALSEQKSRQELELLAQQHGMQSLLQSATDRLSAGETSLEELLRVVLL